MSRGKTLDLLRPDDTGKVQTICTTEVFGCIRALAPFRLTGASRDYIILGSDSGRIVILEYVKEANHFKKVHQETFGKSGCRRIVPGQYLAVDPKGRACMIGAAGLSPCQAAALVPRLLPCMHASGRACRGPCFLVQQGSHPCQKAALPPTLMCRACPQAGHAAAHFCAYLCTMQGRWRSRRWCTC